MAKFQCLVGSGVGDATSVVGSVASDATGVAGSIITNGESLGSNIFATVTCQYSLTSL